MLPAATQLCTTTAQTGEIVMVGANGVLIDQGTNALRVGTSAITMLTNNTERLRVDSSGNIGIGTTSIGCKVQVFGSGWAGRVEVANTEANSYSMFS